MTFDIYVKLADLLRRHVCDDVTQIARISKHYNYYQYEWSFCFVWHEKDNSNNIYKKNNYINSSKNLSPSCKSLTETLLLAASVSKMISELWHNALDFQQFGDNDGVNVTECIFLMYLCEFFFL